MIIVDHNQCFLSACAQGHRSQATSVRVQSRPVLPYTYPCDQHRSRAAIRISEVFRMQFFIDSSQPLSLIASLFGSWKQGRVLCTMLPSVTGVQQKLGHLLIINCSY